MNTCAVVWIERFEMKKNPDSIAVMKWHWLYSYGCFSVNSLYCVWPGSQGESLCGTAHWTSHVTLTLVQVPSRSVIFEPGYFCNSQRVHLSVHDELVEEANLKQTENGLGGSCHDGWIVWELLTKSPAMLLFTVTYLILWPIWMSN